MFILFFKQKAAYEMRISDWSSDVCSSDLARRTWSAPAQRSASFPVSPGRADCIATRAEPIWSFRKSTRPAWKTWPASCIGDRKSGGAGKGVSVSVDLGGRRIIKQQTTKGKEKTQSVNQQRIQ